MKKLLIILLLLISINCLGQKPKLTDRTTWNHPNTWTNMSGAHAMCGFGFGYLSTEGMGAVLKYGLGWENGYWIAAGVSTGVLAPMRELAFREEPSKGRILFNGIGAFSSAFVNHLISKKEQKKTVILLQPTVIDDKLVGGQLALNIKF